MTTREIIHKFIIWRFINQKEIILCSHDFQKDIQDFAKRILQIQHNPETYSREWRRIREKKGQEYTNFYGLMIRKLTDQEYIDNDLKKTENAYLIKKGK